MQPRTPLDAGAFHPQLSVFAAGSGAQFHGIAIHITVALGGSERSAEILNTQEFLDTNIPLKRGCLEFSL